MSFSLIDGYFILPLSFYFLFLTLFPTSQEDARTRRSFLVCPWILFFFSFPWNIQVQKRSLVNILLLHFILSLTYTLRREGWINWVTCLDDKALVKWSTCERSNRTRSNCKSFLALVPLSIFYITLTDVTCIYIFLSCSSLMLHTWCRWSKFNLQMKEWTMLDIHMFFFTLTK